MICTRRLQQMTFSVAFSAGTLRVKDAKFIRGWSHMQYQQTVWGERTFLNELINDFLLFVCSISVAIHFECWVSLNILTGLAAIENVITIDERRSKIVRSRVNRKHCFYWFLIRVRRLLRSFSIEFTVFNCLNLLNTKTVPSCNKIVIYNRSRINPLALMDSIF